MGMIFISIYRYFRKHRGVFYAVMGLSSVIFALFASRVEFEENINSFLPDDGDSHLAVEVFDKLTVKDKIVVMVSGSSDRDSLISAADGIAASLKNSEGAGLIRDIMSRVDNSVVREASEMVYSHLPVFMDSTSYARLDSLTAPDAIRERVRGAYAGLFLPSGLVTKEFILKDPLSLASPVLERLRDFQVESDYAVYGGHLFSRDGSTLLMVITPVYGTGSTGMNKPLIETIEKELEKAREASPSLDIEYFGGPSVGVYNAMQIKKDTFLTSAVALIVIITFISLAFKKKRSIPLILAPVLYGALFSLAAVFFIKGDISAIAVGAGSSVLGIALSYSIHVLAHQNHVRNVEQLIKELAYPLTVGSFTTIGAFLGLLFTSSALLQDFGLFASLALVGTTLFCLVFLPQFLEGQEDEPQGRLLSILERFNAIRFDKSKFLLVALSVLAVVCVFTSRRVPFDDNLNSINYEPEHLAEAEARLASLSDGDSKNVLFVSVGKTVGEASEQYARTDSILSYFAGRGYIDGFSSAERFVVPRSVQMERIAMWNRYWTPEKKAEVMENIRRAAVETGFRENSFDGFSGLLDREYSPVDYEEASVSGLFGNWMAFSDSLVMLISNVRIPDSSKEEVYGSFASEPSTVVFDRSYFVQKWVSAVNDDFYLVLYISSLLVFFALWLSYGRLELALLSFLPMFVSWIIIIGIMGMFGMKFNIINIILSTFIFGIGDDFSIFIMDGLVSKYKYGRDLLSHHKTAIFFSAFTILVGIGSLIFAGHPALKSIAVISIFGIVAVVLVAYIIQPVIFRIFISSPVSRGFPPFTISGILRSAVLFFLFIVGCLLASALIFPLYLVPVRKKRKRLLVSWIMHYSCRMLVSLAVFLDFVKSNPYGETFSKPCIIIANHQSFLDIILMLALTPKVVMLTNSWVWRSPLFGRMIHYAGFVCTDSGYEHVCGHIREMLDDGYKVAVFPEGTRSADGEIRRFHNGAFYIAGKTGADIVPVIFYGHWMALPKSRPFYFRRATVGCRILERISPHDISFGSSPGERARAVCSYMRSRYREMCREYGTARNPYFRESLIGGYIYKGPVTEWYMRVKLKMEDYYGFFDSVVPEKGQVTDIGCGMGALCHMLSMLSPSREVTGIDYDEDKIAIASNIHIRESRAVFICADASESCLPESDVFIMNDMLHYLEDRKQDDLVAGCVERLRPHGIIVIRDGNSESVEKHRLTRLTEMFSTEILKFNKTSGPLHFIGRSKVQEWARKYGLVLREADNDRYTSNKIYILTGK